MKKHCLFFFFLWAIQFSFSQNSALWKGYFSYNEIKDLSQSSDKLFAASENALFYKNSISGEISTTNTVDGLSAQTISSIYHSPNFKKTLVGYENGLMTVINEKDNSILNVVDIINKALPSNIKRINHFMEHNGIVYISCDFGIVQFNLSTLQFGDTYFIGDSGSQISVTQTTVFNDKIYASTLTNGIRSAEISNPNLNDYNQWVLIVSGNWSSIETFHSELIAIDTSGYIHKYNSVSNSFAVYLQLPSKAVDMRKTDNYLLITTAYSVFIYNKQVTLIRQINSNQITDFSPNFTCATSINDIVYIGTKQNGLINTTISESSTFENSTPSGPLRNSVFALKTTPTSFWAVYGDYDSVYNPYPKDSYGISKFNKAGWLHIPYEKVFGSKSLISIAVDPNNENKVYIGSLDSGLLKIENDTPSFLYGKTNSSIEAISDNDTWVNGLVFDKTGNLWINNSLVENGIKTLKTKETWLSFSIKPILSNPNKTIFGRMEIDKNETKWVATNKNGIIGFNENGKVLKKITVGSDAGNLPIDDARVATPDNNKQLWIGTTKGLRILSNIDSFFSDEQLTANPIIIVEENLAQELMYEQFIIDIVVDGANNKWIGTADSGVFLVSPDGQQTIHHFTINNSPLPSNTINDIDINGETGEVFFATTKGLVSYKGTSTDANETLNNVYVYPNPVRPEYTGTVKISGLINKATIKIADIEGNLVYETTSEGGTIEWDTTAFGKYKVASGVYMIFISAQDGIETKVKKVMIIR
ncbi:type IX secretion system anionic LPS delivery protein PorZ [Flavobacterium luteum]|uniref:T9SS type A sorting domain-containing protein n=1 Tax=Flavobacterium luteum TaxID=2026654 RepID=A0A7J5AEL7_9FLAO|nr:T9SS type A sorting domain-containing protein [Flavobacterium luteum]KAB1156022.1 T9SS type A sorting domain-containing protein [Flavobacterium luteum]